MAILISKSKAQSKGAMTQQATANSTFTECLFFLEDAMKGYRKVESKRKIVSKTDFRNEAREMMKRLHPELSKDFWRVHYVHHIDNNPFNNNLNNLEIVKRRLHRIIHVWMRKNLL